MRVNAPKARKHTHTHTKTPIKPEPSESDFLFVIKCFQKWSRDSFIM